MNPELNFYTEEDIITLYGVKINYINKHSKQMGVYCRNPRRFLKSEVDRFFKEKAIEGRLTEEEKEARKASNIVYLENCFKEVCRKH
jgi:hypothetical protein